MLVLCNVSAIPRQVSRKCKAEGSYCTYHDRVVNTWSIVAIATKLTILEKVLVTTYKDHDHRRMMMPDFLVIWQYIYIYKSAS